MKKIGLILIITFCSFTLKGQVHDNKLRLIAGFPDYNFVPETSDLINISAILKLEKDSLIEENIITDSLQRLDFLRCYPEYNRIIAMTKGKSSLYEVVPSLEYQFTIVDTKTLEKEVVSIPNSVVYSGVTYTFYAYDFSFLIEKKELLFVLKYVNYDIPENSNTTGILYYLFNPKTQNLNKIDPAIYRKTIANSSNMVLANSYEGEILKGDTATNVLKIATSKFYGNPIYCDYIPSDIKISRKSFAYAAATVLVNNDSILALYLYEREQKGKWINCRINVYNKQEKTWNAFELETSWVLAKYFDKYIVGNYRVVQLKANDNNFPFKEEYWSKEKTKYGPSYQYYFIDYPVWRYYSEGDLYLYNINDKNIITWNTDHGDSEILLVQKDIVYYRVNDKIYKSPIIDKKKLGNPELLIQDERVPDIHWAFITDN